MLWYYALKYYNSAGTPARNDGGSGYPTRTGPSVKIPWWGAVAGLLASQIPTVVVLAICTIVYNLL